MYWNKEAETMPRERLEDVQLQRLKQTVERAYACVPFYSRALDERGVKPADIRSLKRRPVRPSRTLDNTPRLWLY